MRNLTEELNQARKGAGEKCWIQTRALSYEFEKVSECSEEEGSNPYHRQKTNIMSGRPQLLNIQKELGWDLVLQGTSEIGWDCLHIRRELRWAPGDLRKGTGHRRKLSALPKRIEMEFKRTLWSWGRIEVWGRSQLFDSLFLTIPDRMILKTGGWELEGWSEWYLKR